MSKKENFFDTIIDSEDYICGNKFIEISNTQDILFSKIDYVSMFNDVEVDTFITHNGDYEVNSLTIKTGPKFKRWFAQNKNVQNDYITSIPIGLENFEPEFSYKSMFGKFSSLPNNAPQKKEYISFLSSNSNKHNDLIYLNFNTTTNPSERNYVKNMFIDRKWVTKEENVHWKTYYQSISNSKFCFSPRGNGIDCHRTWEALYLRTIPVLKKEYFLEEFSDLPILFIDDWNDLTEDFLYDKYEEMKKINYNLEKMKFCYWKKQIKNK